FAVRPRTRCARCAPRAGGPGPRRARGDVVARSPARAHALGAGDPALPGALRGLARGSEGYAREPAHEIEVWATDSASARRLAEREARTMPSYETAWRVVGVLRDQEEPVKEGPRHHAAANASLLIFLGR